jgi:cyclase
VNDDTSGRRLAVLAVLVGALLIIHARGQQLGQEAANVTLVKVSEDLFVIHNEFVPGNATALITDEGVVLVDDKFAVDHNNIVSELKRVTSQPIRYVVNTHHHADHSGGNATLQQMNVQVVMSRRASDNMATAPHDAQWSVPNVVFDGQLSMQLGGKRIELYHLGRGHTDGDVVVCFPASRTLVAGDLFVSDPGTPQFVDYAGGGSAKEWTRTLDSVLQIDFDTVVPGHGTVTTKQEMRKFRDSTVVLRSRVHELIGQKKTRDDIARMLQTEFHWTGPAGQKLMVEMFDGLIGELQ